MHFYGLTYQDARQLPLRTFWLMSRNARRIAAENDLRQMGAFAAAQSEKGFSQAQEKLREEAGEVAHSEPPEPIGTEQMKGLMKRLKKG